MKRARHDKPTGVGEILAAMKASGALGQQLELARIWECWDALAGKGLAPHGRPHTVKDGTLHIWADSPVWVHRFAYRKWDLVRRINRLAGRELITDVFVALAPDEEAGPPQDNGVINPTDP